MFGASASNKPKVRVTVVVQAGPRPSSAKDIKPMSFSARDRVVQTMPPNTMSTVYRSSTVWGRAPARAQEIEVPQTSCMCALFEPEIRIRSERHCIRVLPQNETIILVVDVTQGTTIFQ